MTSERELMTRVLPTIVLGIGHGGAEVVKQMIHLIGDSAPVYETYVVAAGVLDDELEFELGDEQLDPAVKRLKGSDLLNDETSLESLFREFGSRQRIERMESYGLEAAAARFLILIVSDLGEPGSFEKCRTVLGKAREQGRRVMDQMVNMYGVGIFLTHSSGNVVRREAIAESIGELRKDEMSGPGGLFSRTYLVDDRCAHPGGIQQFVTGWEGVKSVAASLATFFISPEVFDPGLKPDIDHFFRRKEGGLSVGTAGARGFFFPASKIAAYCARRVAREVLAPRLLIGFLNPTADGGYAAPELDEEAVNESEKKLAQGAVASFMVPFRPESVKKYVMTYPAEEFGERDIRSVIDQYFEKAKSAVLPIRPKIVRERLDNLDSAFAFLHASRFTRMMERREIRLEEALRVSVRNQLGEIMRTQIGGLFRASCFLHALRGELRNLYKQEKAVEIPVPDPGSAAAEVSEAASRLPHPYPLFSIHFLLGISLAYFVYHLPAVLDVFDISFSWMRDMGTRLILAPALLAISLATGLGRYYLAQFAMKDAVNRYIALLNDKYLSIALNNVHRAREKFYRASLNIERDAEEEFARCYATVVGLLKRLPEPEVHVESWEFFDSMVESRPEAFGKYYEKVDIKEAESLESRLVLGGLFNDLKELHSEPSLDTANELSPCQIAFLNRLATTSAEAKFIDSIKRRTIEQELRLLPEKERQKYFLDHQKMFRMLKFEHHAESAGFYICVAEPTRSIFGGGVCGKLAVLRKSGLTDRVYFIWIELDIPIEDVFLYKELLERPIGDRTNS